ncbi:MAG: topoisomerase protein [Parcubacteria group bacterium GW2011_GWF2_38_76]|nr:MAG: topoisomerase protein [Parcubacteria group bacterium GW2011_GWF2_38_76]HBM45688.1 type I DNA topoisomerase [Patescibacteria group bacterium]
MRLLIVESPAKAKTISKYLDNEYTVKASVGHIRDLPKSNKEAIDIDGGFIPKYEISKGKEKVVSELKELAKKSSEILLATDPDREGEAIAWHVAEALKIKNPKRVTFHEITEKAVKEAVKHPREIDQNLRKAQEARRVLDRLVGYDLSGLIWKKVRYGLSAGRVQSPALRILMEREREIRAFIPEGYWVIKAQTQSPKNSAIEFAYSEEPKTQEEADRVVALSKISNLEITDIEESDYTRKPKSPFTTSTLQQAASSGLGFSPARTMKIAQKLYESGHITYMRTDSTTLSQDAMDAIKNVITKEYGEKFWSYREYKTKVKNAQEAHEAIRPTHFEKRNIPGGGEDSKLYDLIWRRTVSSQMPDANFIRTKIVAETGDSTVKPYHANGSRLINPGWLLCDEYAKGEDTILPEVKKGEKLKITEINSEGKQTEPLGRYSEAGLVKELEKRGIGRPSTYAAIIHTIITRGYVEKDGKALKPTDTGEVVSNFLEEHFANIISDTFTAQMEEDLDEIANGTKDYGKILKEFYGPFKKEVESKNKVPKVTTLGDAPKDIKCPECGSGMVIKLGRTGKFLSCDKFPDCTGARTIDGEIMEAPKETGEDCPECKEGKLVERTGKFGKFVACGRYPKCKYIKKDESEEAKKANSTGVKCPECKEGEISERKGRFGTFFSCNNYPKCKFIMKSKPTGRVCDKCGALMMEGTKTIPERCSRKECENNRPDLPNKRTLAKE